MRKLPPYGKPLGELIKSGSKPTNSVNLFIGPNAWKKGESFSISYPLRTLILPAWHSPFIYYWPVKECDILIFDTGYSEKDYVDEVVDALYQDEADIIRFIDSEKNLIVYHKD
jgi:hypothetical protein